MTVARVAGAGGARAARRAGAVALVLALTGVVPLLATSPASAHDYVIASSPTDGATVDAPLDEVTYTFNAPILDLSGTGSSNVLEVVGPDGRHHETACVATVSGATVSVAVALGGPGTYTSTYQVVSSDGHTVSNSQTFEYAPPAGTPTTAGSEARPSCDEGPGAATGGAAEPTGAAEADADADAAPSDATEPGQGSDAEPAADSGAVDVGLVVGVAVAIVVLALAAVVIVLLTGRRRGGDGDASDEGDPSGAADPAAARRAPGGDGPEDRG